MPAPALDAAGNYREAVREDAPSGFHRGGEAEEPESLIRIGPQAERSWPEPPALVGSALR